MQSATERAIGAYVDAHKAEMVAFLRDVVAVPSIWGDVAQLARMGEVLLGRLMSAGVDAQFSDSGTTGMPNVIGRVGDRSTGRRLLLCGHFDVYPPSSSWSFAPFSAPIRDGRVYGPGSADMKGGTTAMVVAATVLAALGLPKGGEMIVLGVPNHFEGGEGTRQFLRSGISAEAGIVCEPTDLEICASQRGILYMTVRIRGIGAHTTAKHVGVNAIEQICPLIAELRSERFVRPRKDAFGDEKIVNVAMVKGGLRRCLIPEECSVTLDVRFSPSTSAAAVLGEVRDILSLLHQRDPSFRATVEPEETCVRNPRSPLDWVKHPILDSVARSHAAFMGSAPSLACHPAWPDTPVMIEASIPSITYGPGSKYCYWDEEFVPIEEFLQAIRVYAATAANWFQDIARERTLRPSI